jgi:ParB-like chromosome segregation protein Spo0J
VAVALEPELQWEPAPAQAAHRDDLVLAPVSALRAGRSPRRGPVRAEHVEALMAAKGAWPPLLVQDRSLAVIDGHHRLAAARALGMPAVWVIYFDGDDGAAELEAVRRNIAHGLTLTLAERKQAAQRVVVRFPDWSDGRIAELCGLSPKTVGRLRSGPTDGADPGLDRRVGRDGKCRPAQPGAARERVAELLTTRSGLSLREIATELGVSRDTVRSVRSQVARSEAMGEPFGPSTSPPDDAPGERAVIHPRPVAGPVTGFHPSWSSDSACASTPPGRLFASWFDRHAIEDADPATFVDSVPLSRVYEVIDECRRRSQFWAACADVLGLRVR